MNRSIAFAKKAFISLGVLGALMSAHSSIAAPPQFLIVGTGGVTGVYYPVGGAICRMTNKKRKETGVRCSVESTQGSVANLNFLADGELDLAVAQSDSQNHAYHGTDIYATSGPNKDLRSVFTLHAEPFTVVASKASGIRTFDDLAGKKVNIGNPGSGQRATMEALMRAKGWSKESFALASELTSIEQSQALCDNKIDAFVFSVGHPAGSMKEAANSCDVVIVSVDGPIVDHLVAQNSYYTKAVVPGGMYRGTDSDVNTFGVSASLVASSTSDAEVIYSVVKNVIENLDSMKKMHPVFMPLDAQTMAANNSDMPMHEGAKRYFKKVGLIE